jgi:hypothetical protein
MRNAVFCAVRAEILEAERVIVRRDSLLEIIQKNRRSCCGGRTETVREPSAKGTSVIEAATKQCSEK